MLLRGMIASMFDLAGLVAVDPHAEAVLIG